MQIPRAPRTAKLTVLLGLAGFVAAVVGACQSPESFHKKADGGLVTRTGGATAGTSDATVGSGGAPSGAGGDTMGSGGAVADSGGASGMGGASQSGGAPGQADAGASDGSTATGGAASGGAGGTASGGGGGGGGNTPGGGGAAGSGAAGGGSGEGGSTSMTCSTCTLTVTYLPIGTADGKSIAAEVHVATTSIVPINRIAIRYWYTNETGSTDITTDIDYVGLSTGTALPNPGTAGGSTMAVTPARTNASTVTSITIPEGMLLRPGTQLYIKFRIHQASYSGTFVMANDYSFGASQTLAMPWPRITAYVNGVRAWGTEPQ